MLKIIVDFFYWWLRPFEQVGTRSIDLIIFSKEKHMFFANLRDKFNFYYSQRNSLKTNIVTN
jgi:hypothetical protein